ncbi:hypothetical protein L9W92_09825 [Pelotomaculum terephthalicicum JT]|uniref:hypothetical protein n=1 Tax=Pelotomaculum TaxID=191373 RepID=UPI0009CB1F83|nr:MULTISPECIES: hypothetical protein [Pelotomaculum]MCG9968350.1 hypothetical protein [Pelotomaculum terephthalicicum JT]OPX87652.1 MAG: hypothetical protein A4E54_01548 [Pelotomaculum sp. PtaB.Bin117]OPY61250.1 MAG: hypothetical protein A4E56_02194 [Pelotomaculum sp. PtaU1.Bin065]
MHRYKEMTMEIFQSVTQAIGIHAMLLVLEHARWKTRQQYEEAALIEFSEEGISLVRLEQLSPEKTEEIAHFFLMSIVATLGRLVGIQIASQLTEQLKVYAGES